MGSLPLSLAKAASSGHTSAVDSGRWGAGDWGADERAPEPNVPTSPWPAGPMGPYPTGPGPAGYSPPESSVPTSPFPYDPQYGDPRVDPRGPGGQQAQGDAWLNPYPGDRSGAWSDSGARRAESPSGSWRAGSGSYSDAFDELSLTDAGPAARRARTYGRPRPQKAVGHPQRSGDGYPTGLRPLPQTPVYRGSFPMRRINSVETPVAEQPDYRRATIYTFAWYGVPCLLYLAWALTLEASRRTFVLAQLGANFVWLLGAAALAVLLGLALRWVAHEWRNLTVSFAAAVMGSGFVTVLHTLITGT